MLDSMTDEELECAKPIDESRKRRIVRGSGVNPLAFDFMMDNFKKIRKMILKFSKMNLGENMGDMMRNPNQLKSKLANMMNPQMLSQMGGLDNIMGMMKQLGGLEKSGKLGDFNKMFANMKKGKKKR